MPCKSKRFLSNQFLCVTFFFFFFSFCNFNFVLIWNIDCEAMGKKRKKTNANIKLLGQLLCELLCWQCIWSIGRDSWIIHILWFHCVLSVHDTCAESYFESCLRLSSHSPFGLAKFSSFLSNKMIKYPEFSRRCMPCSAHS